MRTTDKYKEVSSFSFNQNHFTVFGGRPTHWLSTQKLMLPRLNELRRLPQILGLVTLAVRHATRQAVRGFGRGLQGSTKGANSVIDVAFRSGVLVRDASCSLPVGRHVCLYLRGLALNFECSMQRLLCIDANFFMSCTSVANFPEGVAKFNARGLVCSPAV